MNKNEKDIMRHFRQYHIGVNEMLCFNTKLAKSNASEFHLAISSLIRSGLVIEERRLHAYSLTPEGFVASLSI